MKTQWLIPVILGAAVCLTGCGRRNDLTIQEDMIPVVPVETAAAVQTDLTEGTTGTASAKTETCSAVTALLTGTGKTEAASVTGKTAADAAGTKTSVTKAAETAAQQGDAQQLLPIQPGADLPVPQHGKAAESRSMRLLGLRVALVHGAVFVFRRVCGAESAQQGAPLPLPVTQDLPRREKPAVAVPIQFGLHARRRGA